MAPKPSQTRRPASCRPSNVSYVPAALRTNGQVPHHHFDNFRSFPPPIEDFTSPLAQSVSDISHSMDQSSMMDMMQQPSLYFTRSPMPLNSALDMNYTLPGSYTFPFMTSNRPAPQSQSLQISDVDPQLLSRSTSYQGLDYKMSRSPSRSSNGVSSAEMTPSSAFVSTPYSTPSSSTSPFSGGACASIGTIRSRHPLPSELLPSSSSINTSHNRLASGADVDAEYAQASTSPASIKQESDDSMDTDGSEDVSESSDEGDDVKEEQKQDSKFQCQLCYKTFLRKYNLKEHMKTHDVNPERPYVCNKPRCHASFKRYHDHKRHLDSVHLGLGPSCKMCSRTFKRKDSLTRHLKTACPRLPRYEKRGLTALIRAQSYM